MNRIKTSLLPLAAALLFVLAGQTSAQIRVGPTPAPPAGGGTVTSVAVSGGSTGLTTSGGPVTTSGTITLSGTLAVANGGTGAASASAARTALGLGTAAVKDAPASGNAASGEVVLGSDTRLTDARTPTTHSHAFSDLTGSATNSQLPGTLSSKTFDNTNTAAFKGTLFTLQDAADTTKQARFDLSNVTAGQTRSVNIPDAASTTAQAKGATANQFLTAMSAQGVFSAAQPAFSDISGSATDAQIPNSITVDLAATATTANSGDSATAFFSSGTVEAARILTGTVTNSRCVRVNSSGQLETHSADCGSGGGGSLSFTSMTLSGTWVDWGGTYSTAAYTKTSEGLVILRGMIKGGATTAGSLITTLPAGFRPAADQIYVIQHGGSFGYVILHSDGTLTAEDYSNATWSLSLDTIRFVAEQ